MSLHKKAVKWLTGNIPNAKNNHYGKKARFNLNGETFIPDVVAKGEFHEVETVQGKKKILLVEGKRKILWVFINNFEVFDQINIVGCRVDASFSLLSEIHYNLLTTCHKEIKEIYNYLEQKKMLELEIEKLRDKKKQLIQEIKSKKVIERLKPNQTLILGKGEHILEVVI